MRFPYFLVTLVSAWVMSRWNGAVALHNPNDILFHWNSPSSHAKPVFSRSCFLSGTCRNAEPKSNVVKNFASPSLERLSSMRGIGYASFIVTAFKQRKPQQNLSCPLSFWPLPRRKPYGDFDGSIMSYSINISISFLHASDLCGVILLAPSL